MCNTAKIRLVLDIAEDGTFVIWGPGRPIGCQTITEVTKVLNGLASGQNVFRKTLAEVAQSPKGETESLSEFLSRGGTITRLSPGGKRVLSDEEINGITLESLGLLDDLTEEDPDEKTPTAVV